MSLFPHMLGHHDAPKAANDNVVNPEFERQKTEIVQYTVNHVSEILMNGEDLMELRAEVAANDNSLDMQDAA